MVSTTMIVASNVGNRKRKKSESKPNSQANKCLNEKRRREQENIHIEELAELVSASPSDMSSLSCKPDKCAILKETVNQIRSQKLTNDNELCDDLQQSEVSSSKPNIINNHIFGSILLEALEGFLFIVNIDGKVEFVSENIQSFLKYNQEEVYEKNIYDFIHPDDRARFNSNLLLMMPLGNGRDWTSDNNFNPTRHTKHFNIRFIVKEANSEMENKSSDPQYESLNISANYMPLGDSTNDETKNGLTCIARRASYEDKRVGLNKVEHFTTRIDRDWKVLDLDTSQLSQLSSQFLRSNLLGSLITDFCHSNDEGTLKHHIKETFESDGAISIPYKFKIGLDRYASIKTKSRLFRNVQSTEDYVMSTHSIIRDSDSSTSGLDNQRCVSSPSTASTSSGPGSVSDSSVSMNGSSVLSPLSLPNTNSYGNFPNSISIQNPTVEFGGLSDFVLDMVPGQNWNMDPSSIQSKESNCSTMSSMVSSPQAAPLSNHSDSSVTVASPTNNAFAAGLPPSNRSTSSVPSPAMQSRSTTPYSSGAYSPSSMLQAGGSGRSPSPRQLPANASSSGDMQKQQYDLKSNQKLRNLLTQSTNSNSGERQRLLSQEDVAVFIDSRMLEEASRSVAAQRGNIILRDLLNQEEDQDVVPVEPINSPMECAVPNPLLNAAACKATENSARQIGNNNMLRKLLNSDDSDRQYHRKPDLIQKLLISNNKAATFQANRARAELIMNPRTPNVTVARTNPLAHHPVASDVNALKRKAAAESSDAQAKKTNSGPGSTELAGQNPMLASMLAQTPRAIPVDSSVASSIMNQLPQERLPKNLDKKLVQTPYTTIMSQATSSGANYSLASPKDIVTSDARGHLLQQPQQQQQQQQVTITGLSVQNARALYAQQRQLPVQQQQRPQTTQQHQLLMDRLTGGSLPEDMLAKSGTSVSTSSAYGHLNLDSTSTTASLNDMLNDVMRSSPNNQILLGSSPSETVQMNSAASSLDDVMQTNEDRNMLEIVDQVFSLQEEHKCPTGITSRESLLKLFFDPSSSTTPEPIAQSPSVQDINEKIAISAIQKELMEAGSAAIANETASHKSNSTAHLQQTQQQQQQQQLTNHRTINQMAGTSLLQAQLTPEHLLLLQQQQQAKQQQQQQLAITTSTQNYNVIANRMRLPTTATQQTNLSRELQAQMLLQQRRQLGQNVNINSAAQVRNISKALKQRLFQQQQQQQQQQLQQKRLLEQQQKQQLVMQTQQPLEVASSSGTSVFPENMNDLLNNTVAPNVTLRHSSGIPDVSGSTRFNLSSSTPLPSPTSQPSPSSGQISPGPQRVSPFSPHPPQYPQQKPPPTSQSPSPGPSPVQSPQWSQPQQRNLQSQNPMLNAQLSQKQDLQMRLNASRLTAQRQQLAQLRTMPNTSTVQNVRSVASMSNSQSDANINNTLSAAMLLQAQNAQVQQQQLQQQQQQQQLQQQLQQQQLQQQLQQQQQQQLQQQLQQHQQQQQQQQLQQLQQQQLSQQQLSQQQQQQLSQQQLSQQQQQQQLSQQQQQLSQQQQQQLSQQLSQPQQQQQLQQQLQQLQQQQRVQRSRLPSGSQNQLAYSSNDSLLSPQPLPSPSYSQPSPSTSFASVSSSATYTQQHFTFERQNNAQSFANVNESLCLTGNDVSVNDSLTQELRSLINNQSQLVLSNNNQHLIQYLSSGSGSSSLNENTLTKETLEQLGLSIENPSGGSPSQVLYAQALLNEENQMQPGSPNIQNEEPKPADQKTSLLQQLLSEPT